ncbi:MAG: chemotaxis protein CheX [Mycobacteriales bacterium]
MSGALAIVNGDQITAITAEIFAAMVDGKPGLLVPWSVGDDVLMNDPLHAWVDMHAGISNRVQLTTDAETAHELTRMLLAMTPGEEVGEEDLNDAYGEIANVVGGNLKALLPVQGQLMMPQVSREAPSDEGAVQFDEVTLAWRGHPIIVSVWMIR